MQALHGRQDRDYAHVEGGTHRRLWGCVDVANVADDASPPDFWTVVRLDALHRLQGRSSVSLREVLLTFRRLCQVDPLHQSSQLYKTFGLTIPEGIPFEQQDLWAKKICVVLRGSTARDQRNDWEQLPDLFGGDPYTEAESNSESQIEDGYSVATLSVRICAPPLSGRFAPLAEQMMLLHSMTQAARAVTALEDPAMYVEDENSVVKFELEAIDLDLRPLEIQVSILKAITELLGTGVAVHSVTLPQRLPSTDDEFPKPLLEAWGVLVSSICGSSNLPEASSTRVRRLVLPTVFTEVTDLFVPLCSTLRISRNLETLRIQFDDRSSPKKDEAVDAFWMWLSFALFGAGSSSSIQSLDLDGILLSPVLLDQVTQVCETADAQRILHTATASDSLNAHLSIIGEDSIFTNSTEEPARPSRRLTSLRVRYSGRVPPGQRTEQKRNRRLVAQLVQIPAVGSDLRDLLVDDCWSFTDQELEVFLGASPHLEHLRISGANFTSDCFRRAYERGAALSSLEITSGNFSIREFEALLELLTIDGPVKATLKRLQVDRLLSKHFEEKTVGLLEAILRDPHTLHELQLFTRAEDNDLQERLTPFHGQIVPLRPLSARERVAFISCHQASRLDQDAVALIFRLAAPTTHRSVIVKVDEPNVVTWAEMF